MPRRPLQAATALSLLATAVACRAIPDYRFEDDLDGAADTSVARDATPSEAAPSDAAPSDAAPSDADAHLGPTADAAPDAPGSGCPGTPPPYATACCGPVPCAGDCPAACAECAARCGASEACCAKRSNVQCKRQDGFVCN